MKIDLTGLEKIVTKLPDHQKGVFIIGITNDKWFEKLYNAKHFDNEWPLSKIKLTS